MPRERFGVLSSVLKALFGVELDVRITEHTILMRKTHCKTMEFSEPSTPRRRLGPHLTTLLAGWTILIKLLRIHTPRDAVELNIRSRDLLEEVDGEKVESLDLILA
jgi:hypothetical protein